MAKGARPRVKVPKTAAVGETITIKTLIKHKMESGQRRDEDGNTISLQESDKEGLKRIADSGSTNVWANEDGAPTSI